MIILGLTGSIGMGKSTTAALFAAKGVPVYSADAAVHALYQQEEVIKQIADNFAHVVKIGKKPLIDRAALSHYLLKEPSRIKKLEKIIHPRLRAYEEAFLQQSRQENRALVVLDIPLLYETGAEARMDYVAVVSASPDIQRRRVLAREGMSEEKFNMLLARQMPDEEKRKRADFILNSGEGIEKTKEQVKELIEKLTKQNGG